MGVEKGEESSEKIQEGSNGDGDEEEAGQRYPYVTGRYATLSEVRMP